MNSSKPTYGPSFVITLGVLTGMAALTVDLSLPAVPAMVIAMATSLSQGQQIVGVFMAGMAVGQIPSGLIADRIGRLPVLYVGISVFGIAAIAAAAATQIEVMLTARFVQGFGAAAAIVLSRAIVRDIASGKEAAKLMSLMTMIFTAAPVIAPTFGALLVAAWGWRAPFIAIAALGVLVLLAVRTNLHETHAGNSAEHPIRQLRSSFAEFFSHRQSIFGLLIIIIPPFGFMSLIAMAASLVVDIYGYSVTQFGLIFAVAGGSILIGAASNRLLVTRFEPLQIIGLGVTIMSVAAAQMSFIAWTGTAPLAWVWTCNCMFMFTIPLILANATVIALDPLPTIAGVASSILGTLQNVMGAAGALIGASIYNGTLRNTLLLISVAGFATTLVFLFRRLIVPGGIVHHPQELARD